MFFITGDTHGSYSRIREFSSKNHLCKNDTLIILGDTGLNYFGDERDVKKKRRLSLNLTLTLFFIHGNHDIRPANISTYQTQLWNGGIVYSENDFPNFLFAKDGEVFNFAGRKTIVIGGAYSIDKQYRLDKGYNWFEDEQPNDEIKANVEKALDMNSWQMNTVLTHTCPLKYEPKEAFFTNIDQNTVDKSTEIWLDKIEDNLDYKHWYCGHFHIDKNIGKLRFLFNDIIPL